MKKNHTKLIVMGIILTLMAAMAVLFTSCGGPETLEEALKSDEETQELLSGFEASGVEISAEDNTLVYTLSL